jgi:hypothetical protein
VPRHWRQIAGGGRSLRSVHGFPPRGISSGVTAAIYWRFSLQKMANKTVPMVNIYFVHKLLSFWGKKMTVLCPFFVV